ncbi:MAG: hypothetical protein SNJ77_06210 [Cytophagales bacterium]
MRKYIIVLFSMVLMGVILFNYLPKNKKAFAYKLLVNPEINVDSSQLKPINKKVLKTAHLQGKKISPTYQSAVCTEYVIGVLSKLTAIDQKTKQKIRIITNNDLDSLFNHDAPVLKGVVKALVDCGIGEEVDINEAKPGDFVQFWDNSYGFLFGHCGILRGFDGSKTLMSLYSSAPSTNGHGIQTYIVTKKTYFVRLKRLI